MPDSFSWRAFIEHPLEISWEIRMSFLVHIFVYLLVILGALILVECVLLIFRLKWAGLTVIYSSTMQKHLAKGFSRNKGSSLRILVLGDSTATGSLARPEDSIAGRLSLKFNADVRNLGQDGAKIRDVIGQINAVQDGNYDLVLIQAGNNDIVRFTNLKAFRHDVALVFDLAKRLSRQVVMLRGGNVGNFPCFPLSIGWLFARRSRKIRDICMQIAREKGVLYVELFMSRKEDVFLKDVRKYYTSDLIHLNSEGYKVWFEYLMREMEKSEYTIIPARE